MTISGDGRGEYVYQPTQGQWFKKNFVIDQAMVTKLGNQISSCEILKLNEVYEEPKIADGTQWCLLIKQQEIQKAVYFNNLFPENITQFATFIDDVVIRQAIDPAPAQVVPEADFRKHEVDIWKGMRSRRNTPRDYGGT